MEVEIHRETQRLLTASQYSLHNIHPDSREGLNFDFNMKNCSCQAHITLTSLKWPITSLRHTVLFYCSFSWPRFPEWVCTVQASSPLPQRYLHWPAGHKQLCISGLLRIPARLPCMCLCPEVKLISLSEQGDNLDSFFQKVSLLFTTSYVAQLTAIGEWTVKYWYTKLKKNDPKSAQIAALSL